MKLLLDTHVFLWWDSQPDKLSQYVLSLLHNPQNELFLSVASVWEMQIKQQLGKLELRLPLAQLITDQQVISDLQMLPILQAHALGVADLPPIHKDPFDRMLIAQASIEQMGLVSADGLIKQYPIVVLWDN